MSKINRFVNNSPEIKEELGKIVLRRFTNFAETWYYSISDAEHVRIEENWTTLKKVISEYWMNHHWLEKQKLTVGQTGLGLERLGTSKKVPVNMLFIKWNF